jgi:hypothetical protein
LVIIDFILKNIIKLKIISTTHIPALAAHGLHTSKSAPCVVRRWLVACLVGAFRTWNQGLKNWSADSVVADF